MTASPSALPPEGAARARWMIFAPATLLVAVAAAWSGFWWYAAGQAETALDRWVAREAQDGRIYACGERRLIGYPFRIELVCEQPTARLPGDGGPVVASAPRLVVAAQVYDPRRLIGEFSGPITATDAAGRRAELIFGSARTSGAAGPEGRFDRTSIALEAPRLVVDGAEIGAAQNLDLHLRRKPGGPDGAYDLAAKLVRGVSPVLDVVPPGEGPLSIELQAEALGVGDLRPRPSSERLRAFAAAGGRVQVALARIERGEVVAEAKGDVGLDPEGRLDGALKVTARGLDDLAQRVLGDAGGGGLVGSLFGAGAKMLGKPAKLDGRPATAYRLTFDRGRVEVGPIRLGRAPALF